MNGHKLLKENGLLAKYKIDERVIPTRKQRRAVLRYLNLLERQVSVGALQKKALGQLSRVYSGYRWFQKLSLNLSFAAVLGLLQGQFANADEVLSSSVNRQLATQTQDYIQAKAAADFTSAAQTQAVGQVKRSVQSLHLLANQSADESYQQSLASLNNEEFFVADNAILTVIDPALNQWEVLSDAVQAGEVLLLKAGESPLEQIIAKVKTMGQVKVLNILSHGADGEIYLAGQSISAQNLNKYKQQLQELGALLTEDGQLQLFGCDVAKSGVGKGFITELAQITGADVAGSVNLTGSGIEQTNQPSDWDLEYFTGEQTMGVAQTFNSKRLLAYNNVLQTVYTFEDLPGYMCYDYGECSAVVSDITVRAVSSNPIHAVSLWGDYMVSALPGEEQGVVYAGANNGGLWLMGGGVQNAGVPRSLEVSKTDASDFTPNSVKVRIWTYRSVNSTSSPDATFFEIVGLNSSNVQVASIKYESVYDDDTIDINFSNPASSVYTRNNGGYFTGAPTLTQSGSFATVRKLQFKTGPYQFGIDDLSIGALVVNNPPVNSVAPAITGTATVGNALFGSDGSWTDVENDPLTYSRQWYRADDASGTNRAAIASATGATYTLTTSDAHKYIQLVATANDGNGGTQTANSTYIQVANTAPVNGALPSISGTATVGNLLSTTNGTWSDADGDGRTYSYQWYRADDSSGTNLAVIAGANSSSYTLTANDAQKYLRVVVTANDGYGGTTPANSGYTSAVNTLPSDIALSSSSVNQSAGVNAIVGTLSSTDPDIGNTFTYTLVAGVGDTHNTSFNISGSSLRANDSSALTAGNHSVRIRTTDQGGLSTEKAFTIVVTDDVAPTFQNSTPSVSNINTTGATLTARLNEIGTAFFVVVADGATAPSSAQVVAGLNNSGAAALASGSVAVVSAGADFTTAIAGLSAGTAYDIYVVAQDDEITPNAQATPTLVNLTTSTQNALYFDDNAKVTGLTGISPAAFTVEFRLFLDSQTPPGNWQGIYWTNNNNDTGVFIEDNYAVSLWTTQSTAYKSDLLLTYGAWNHVAISYSAGNGVRMYINGVLSSISSTGIPGAGVLPLTDVTIGYGPGNFGLSAGGYALGDSALEDFRIWNVERTQQEINDNKDAELAPPYSANLVRYYDFNHGIGGSNNAGFSTLIERTGNGANGTLTNFALNGDVSNWVETSSLVPVPVNQAPVISNLNSDSVAWPGVGNTVTLDFGGNASVADTELDAANWGGASLTVQRNVGGTNTPISSDLFSFNSSGYTLSGGDLQTGGTTFGTFTNTNGVLTISFNANATNSLVRDVVRGIVYRNDTPAGDATIRFALSDGTSSTTADVTVTTDYVYVTNATDTAVIDLANGVSFSEAVAIAAADLTGSQTLVLSSALTGTMSLAGNLAINESLTIDGDAANGLAIAGSTITLAGGTTLNLTKASGTLTVGSTLAGSGALSKSGGGTLALTSITNNSGWSGALSVLGGSLSVSGSTTPTFLPTGTLTLNGGTLSMTVVGTPGTTLTVPNSLVLGASGGTISVGGNDTLNAANFSGVISGTGSLTKSGMAILRLSGTNEYAGITNVSAGTLRIASDSNLGSGNVTLASGVTLDVTGGTTIDNSIALEGDATVNNSGSLTLSGVVSGANTLIKSGPGTLTLSGTNTYSATTVNAGTLSVAGDANLGSGVLTLNGATFNVTTNSTTIDNAIEIGSGGGSFSKPSGTLTLTGSLSGAGSITKTGAGALSHSGSGTLTLDGANITTSSGSGAMTLGSNIVLGSSGGIFDLTGGEITLNGNISGSGSLTRQGGFGLLWLMGNNSHTGTQFVVSGWLVAGSATALGTGQITLSDGTTLAFNAGIASFPNNIVLAGNTTLRNANPNDTVTTLTGAISESGGSRNVTVQGGTGTNNSFVLTGTNTYTGTTTLSAGVLQIENANNISAAGITLGSSSATFNISGSNVTLANNINLTGSSTITNANAVTLSGVISGNASLTKRGLGTLSLSGTNSHSGTTTVAGGTLAVIGSTLSSTTVAAGGTLAGTGTLSGTVNIQSGGALSPGVSGAGSVTLGNGLSLQAGGTLAVDIAGTTAGTGYDQLLVSGTVNLAGSLAVNHGYTAGQGDSYTIIVNNSAHAITGTFSDLAEGATTTASGNGTVLTASYTGGNGNDFTLAAPLNTAPVIANLNGDSVSFIEDSDLILLDANSDATVTDSDSTDFDGGNVTVSIAANRVATEDVLSIRNEGTAGGQIGTSGLNITYGGTLIGTRTADGGTDINDLVITLNSAATPAIVQALVRNLTYTNTNTTTPDTNVRTVRVTVNDGDGGTSTSSNADIAVAVVATNDAPTLTTTGATPTFTEGGASVGLFSGTSVSTVEPGQLITMLTVTVTNVSDGSDEILYFDGSDIPLINGFTGTSLIHGVDISVAVTGSTATLMLVKTTGLSAAQTLVDGMTYRNNSLTPTVANRVITITALQDDGGVADGGVDTSSPKVSATVTIAAVNSVPVVTTSADVTAFTEGNNVASTPVVIDSGITVSDLDNATLASATVSLTANFQAAEDMLAFTNDGSSMGNISASYDSNTGVLTLTSSGATATLAEWEIALAAVTYTNNSETPSESVREISFVVNDGVDASVASTKSVSVTAVNDTPTISVAGAPLSVNQGDLYDFTPSSSDIDGDTLIYDGVNIPSWISVDPNTGRIYGTPGPMDVGVIPFEFFVRVSDDNGANWHLSSGFFITVVNVNDAPVISGTPATTVNQGELYSFTPVASDVDAGDTLTFTATGLPSWLSINPATGAISGTPSNADVGETGSIVITVTDDAGEAASLPAFTITVVNVNDAPVISGTPATTVNQGELYSFTPVASDVDAGDTLTFTATGLPSWLSINPVTGAIFGTPGNADVGETGSIVITVTDDAGEAASLPAFTITVVNVNDAPVISGTPATTVNQDELYNFTPVASDVDAGDTLTFTATGLPSWLSINPVTGAISGTPSNADVGETGSIVITVTDDAGEAASLPAFSITVVNVNDAPVISGTPATTVNQGELYSFTPVASDVDAGDTLTFTATGLPSWLSINPATGAISGTPSNADVGETGSIVITVTDDAGEAASLPAFTITVVNVNDAPVISGTPATSVNQGELYSFTPVASDVDEGDTLTFTATGLPSWLSINPATGAISGTPGNADVGETDSIVITVTDDAGAEASLPAFTITVANVNDAPVISGTPATSVNQDELYNFTPVAVDIDEDTLTFSITNKPDWAVFDEATGVLSGTPAHAHVGITTGIVISVSDGTLTASLPAFNLEVIETIDPLLPVVTAPADITLNSTGLYTPVSLRQLLSLNPSVTQEQVEAILNSLASDGVSGNSCCTTHPEGLNDNGLLLLPPGRHEVVWSATNAADVSGTATQVVAINPLVSLSKSQIAIRGSAVEFRVLLNGKAPEYPFAVPYVLDVATTAANTEHSLVSGVAHFTAAGQLAVSVPVSITNLSGLTDSELVVSLDDSINTGVVNTHTISIREGNIAPAVTLQLMQAGVNTTQITPSGGLVTVAATVIDLNSGDTHSYDWSASDRLLGDIDGDPVNHTFVFDPSGLTGRHQVQLAVTDSGGASTSAQLYFRIVDSLPVLLPDADTDGDGIDDETEGFGDSNGNGIPNYLDNMPSSNVLPQQGAVTHAFLLECDPGLRCGLGQFALDSRSGGVQIFDEELASIDGLTADQTFEPVGGIFDFVINDLPIPGQSARVVIPQQAPIPADAVYRKYQNGTWVSFLENANNAIHSAPGNAGYCPPPGNPQWTLGLTEGHLCVQLTIEDGGPNDDDGLVNSAIADPGVVSVALPVEPPTPQPPKPDIKLTSKGGGAVDGVWILLLGGLLMMQWLRTARCKGLIAVVLLGTSVSSQALTYDQAFVRVDVYKVEGGMRNAEFNQTLNAGYNFTLDNYRADRRGYQIAIGYQWHDYLYTELGYLDLGDVNVDMTLNGETDLPAFEQDLDSIYPRSGKGVTLVQGLTLFSEQPLNVSLEAGAYLWRDDRRTNQTRIKLDDAEGVAPLAGIRLNMELTKTLSLGVNTRRIYLDNETVDLYSLSGRYRF